MCGAQLGQCLVQDWFNVWCTIGPMSSVGSGQCLVQDQANVWCRIRPISGAGLDQCLVQDRAMVGARYGQFLVQDWTNV